MYMNDRITDIITGLHFPLVEFLLNPISHDGRDNIAPQPLDWPFLVKRNHSNSIYERYLLYVEHITTKLKTKQIFYSPEIFEGWSSQEVTTFKILLPGVENLYDGLFEMNISLLRYDRSKKHVPTSELLPTLRTPLIFLLRGES